MHRHQLSKFEQIQATYLPTYSPARCQTLIPPQTEAWTQQKWKHSMSVLRGHPFQQATKTGWKSESISRSGRTVSRKAGGVRAPGTQKTPPEIRALRGTLTQGCVDSNSVPRQAVWPGRARGAHLHVHRQAPCTFTGSALTMACEGQFASV